MVNQWLVDEQVKHFERTGTWRGRRVSSFKTPLLVSYVGGFKEVREGTVNGLIHVHSIGNNLKVYSDIRNGSTVSTTYGANDKELVPIIGPSMNEIYRHKFCMVRWAAYGIDPVFIYGDTIEELRDQYKNA